MAEKMVSNHDPNKVIRPIVRRTVDARRDFCDHIRLVCATVAANAENYLPDSIYSASPGEMVIRIPLDGLPSVEVSTETFLERE
jgi:hypothetical protein